MALSYEERQKELEKILREIYNKYRTFYTYGIYFYYKLKGKKLKVVDLDSHSWSERYSRKGLKLFFKVLLDPRLEYALYTFVVNNASPSWDCDVLSVYIPPLYQFIPPYNFLERFEIPFISNINDPLSQVFAYRRVLLDDWIQHAYGCPYIFLIFPHNSDPSSIFHGKKGVVAYCISFADIIRSGVYVFSESVVQQFKEIEDRAEVKLRELLKKKGRSEACNLDTIMNVIRDEIEKANKLMREYNIIRVAFPLD